MFYSASKNEFLRPRCRNPSISCLNVQFSFSFIFCHNLSSNISVNKSDIVYSPDIVRSISERKKLKRFLWEKKQSSLYILSVEKQRKRCCERDSRKTFSNETKTWFFFLWKCCLVFVENPFSQRKHNLFEHIEKNKLLTSIDEHLFLSVLKPVIRCLEIYNHKKNCHFSQFYISLLCLISAY